MFANARACRGRIAYIKESAGLCLYMYTKVETLRDCGTRRKREFRSRARFSSVYAYKRAARITIASHVSVRV